MTLKQMMTFFSRLSFLLGAKIFLLTFVLFYLFFALILLRQVFLLTNVLNVLNFSPVLKIIGFLHLGVALIVLLLALLLF